jgi:transposase
MHGVHLTMVAAWKRAAIEGMTATFSPKSATSGSVPAEADIARLHAKIGQLVVERGCAGLRQLH